MLRSRAVPLGPILLRKPLLLLVMLPKRSPWCVCAAALLPTLSLNDSVCACQQVRGKSYTYRGSYVLINHQFKFRRLLNR